MKHILTSLFLLIAVSVSAQSTFEELISKSYDYIEKDSLFLAELTLKAALKKEPANPINYSLLTNLGTIQRRLGKKQEALESYSAALSRQPKNTMILSNRASLYAELGNVEKAINDYTALLIQDPQHEDARYARGLLYIEQRNFVAAEADFNTILETNEKTIRGRLGYAILEKARGNYVESEKIFNYLIEKRRYFIGMLIFQSDPGLFIKRHLEITIQPTAGHSSYRQGIYDTFLTETAAEKVSQRCFHRGFCFAVPVHSQDKIPENVSVSVVDLVRDGHPDMANNPRPFYLSQRHRFMSMYTGNTRRAFPRRSEYTRRHSSLSFFSRS